MNAGVQPLNAAAQLPPHLAGKSLAAWLAMVHPELFNLLVGKQMSKGLGDWSDVLTGINPVNTDVQVDVSSSVTAALQNIGGGEVGSQPDNSSSVSSWLSSIGSGVSNAVASVGNWLTSDQGLSTLANTATSYFKAQANQSAAAAQQSILQTQMARAQAGQAAAPITYVQNPQTGAWQAAYVSNGLPPSAIAAQDPLLRTVGGTAAYPLTRAGLAQLTPSSFGTFLQQYGLWIAGGLIALFVLPRLLGARE